MNAEQLIESAWDESRDVDQTTELDSFSSVIDALPVEERQILRRYSDVTAGVRRDFQSPDYSDEELAEEIIYHTMKADRAWRDDGPEQIEKSVRFHVGEWRDLKAARVEAESVDVNSYWQTLTTEFDGGSWARYRKLIERHRLEIDSFLGIAIPIYTETADAAGIEPSTPRRTEFTQTAERMAAWSFRLCGKTPATNKPPMDVLPQEIPSLLPEHQVDIARRIAVRIVKKSVVSRANSRAGKAGARTNP